MNSSETPVRRRSRVKSALAITGVLLLAYLGIAYVALPAWWRKRHPPATWPSPLARRRRGAGLCPKCAYDLRATPGRCPECGSEIAPGVESSN